MTLFSSRGIRCLCLVLVLSLVGCLLLVPLYSMPSQSSVLLPDEMTQMLKNHHSEHDELVAAEELEIPTLSGGQAAQTTSLVDEFLNKDSQVRHFIFPDERNAIDPRKENDQFYYYPGRIWLDTDGNHIQVHGGGVLYDENSGKYYWYGEYKDGPTYIAHKKGYARVDIIGVGCYSSKDLWTWKNEGIVLKAEENNKTHDLHKSNVLERPKVIYNEKTSKYVMWMHIDNAKYAKAATGIAISDTPTGPFSYLHSKSPHGFDSRDMTVFKDEDGTAYLFYASMHNKDMHVSELTEDYLDVANVMTKVLVGQHREAPSVFKHHGNYYMITSGCSGWTPNEAMAHVAKSVVGPWETIGRPCVGANKVFRVTTFFAQGTFVLPMPGGPPGSFVFMADRWKPEDLQDSRYVWLPLTVEEEANPQPQGSPIRLQVSISWHRRWRIPYKRSDNYSSRSFL